jgi:hypothetical protein
MPRSFNDCVLLVGGAIAVFAALGLTVYNVKQGSVPQAGSSLLLLGTLIALLCALIAIGVDLQDSVTTRLGALAYTSILQSWHGWASLLGWGAFTIGMFQLVLLYPTWASQTFHFEVSDNLLSAGFLVGVSAMIIIRSKLAKVGNIEYGGEWLYLWSSAQVLSAVNRKRIASKSRWEGKFQVFVINLAKYPDFFTDLETNITGILLGLSKTTQAALTVEFQRIRSTYIPAGDPNPTNTINGSILARRYLVSAVLDHIGHTDILAYTNTLPP